MTKRKFLLALPVIAVLAIPGEASQPIGQGIPRSPEHRLMAMQSSLGLALDPHQAVELSFSMPKSFTALDMSADPFAN